MTQCDTFVFLDDVQINRRSYTRRVKIKNPDDDGKQYWLTVPLKKHPQKAKINEINIDHSEPWILRHKNVLNAIYGKSAQWAEVFPWIEERYAMFQHSESLAEMNIELIKNIAKMLKINCVFVKSSEIPVTGKADTYTYRIVKYLDGTQYFRGKGELLYARNPVWNKDHDLELIDIDYTQMIKEDTTGAWRNGFSILHELINSVEPRF